MPNTIQHRFWSLASGPETLTYTVAINSSGEYEATSSAASTVAASETRDRLVRDTRKVVMAVAGRHYAKH